MDLTGYRQAIIHLAWFRDDQVRHLLFGMVELRPNEFPDAIGCPPQSFRAKNKSRKCLHYRRFVLSVQDAIAWYRNAANGNLILPHDPNHRTKGDGAKLEDGTSVKEEPPWPRFVTSNKLAFAPDWSRIRVLIACFRKTSYPRKSARLSESTKTGQSWRSGSISISSKPIVSIKAQYV